MVNSAASCVALAILTFTSSVFAETEAHSAAVTARQSSINESPVNESTAEESKVEESNTAYIEESLVIGERRGNFTEITQETQKLVDMPGALGDPLAAIFSLPGVIYSSGRGGEPAVRGSSPSDNLFNVDFMPAGYIFHEFNTSVFHEFIVQDFQLYSAGFGPEYSNVTGAVFDIRLREPKKEPLSAVVDLSMLRSGVFVESQVTENSAFYLSARKSLIHLFIPEGEEATDGIIIQEAPQDDDYQFKYAWEFNRNNQITFSANGASDTAAATFTREADFVRSNPDFAGDAEIENRFNGQTIIWDNYGDAGRHFKLGVGRLNTKAALAWGDDFFQEVLLRADTIKTQYVSPVGESSIVTIGAKIKETRNTYETDQIHFVCTEFEPDCTLGRRDRVAFSVNLDHTEHSVYLNENWQATNKLSFDIGVQWQQNDFTQEQHVNPRVAARYEFGGTWALNTSAGRYNRFPDVETVIPGIGNPELKSPTATHYTLGVEQSLNNGWSWTVESYYKNLKNLPLALRETDENAEDFYTNGVDGKAWGLDLLINKDLTDKWYSWVALSYSKSERRNSRTDKTMDYYLDTPMVFNWVVNYSPSETFNLGWRWTIRSGTAYTPIVGLQENPYFDEGVLPVYDEPFSDRLPVNSRLDLRFKWLRSVFGKEAEYTIDIINALNQKNVTDRSLDYDKINSVNDDVAIEERQSPGIIPALGLRIKF